MIECPQILGDAFRQQYSIRFSRHDSSEIIERDTAPQWIDPYIAAKLDGTGGREEIAGLAARQRSIRRHHRILQVEDQRIRARLRGTDELAFAIGRNKQQAAHHPSVTWHFMWAGISCGPVLHVGRYFMWAGTSCGLVLHV